MENSADSNTTEQASSTDHSEIRVTWIGMALFIAFFILDWLSGWQI
jgi:hypothetical protein